MIVTLIPYSPQSRGKNLGFAYNEMMARLRDDDWACFIDHDACFTTYDWYAQLEEITEQLTEPCVLTAVTNRVGSHWQLVPGVDRDNHSMTYHRQLGAALQSASRHAIRDVTNESLMSGVLILLSKEAWSRLGGFADGFLGVDNAIHQAARDRGFRVYLMEGVYVYHWYRAEGGSTDPSGERGIPLAERTYRGCEPLDRSAPSAWLDVLGRPNRDGVAGRRVLLIGYGVSSVADRLEQHCPKSLNVVEMDRSILEQTRQGPRKIAGMDDDGNGVWFPDEAFDVVLAPSLLDCCRSPERILSKLRSWLACDGRLMTRCRNTRELSIVEGLLKGRWLPGGEVTACRRPIRFFTRREVEKLLHRTGYTVDSVDVLPNPDHAEWVAVGRPCQVTVGGLHISGLPDLEVEEFHSLGFEFEAKPRRLSDRGLTSIIIVTHNQVEYTRQCLESLRRSTKEPYELILVDNASTDGTTEFLSSMPGARLITNEQNLGFPMAVNQGIAMANGNQVVLLNNDTILTTGWLGRLLDALHRDPMIGLVGPCSNWVSGPQQVEIGYDDLASLDGFAWEWGKANAELVVDTDRLVGFCLLIRREVIDKIGLFDERFGIGCFEDDDYCLRATRAGFRAVIARGAFIHHFGSRTFLASSVDFGALLSENEQKFRAKWESTIERDTSAGQDAGQKSSSNGMAAFAVDVAPGGSLLLRRRNVQLSLCMIVRDSSQTLPASLESIRPWVDEMVIVDTGSVDDTPQIAEAYGGRLFHFPWCDDFSAARNESLRHARGEWLFWMDSDDTISSECGRDLRRLATGPHDPNVLGYVMQVHCPGEGEEGDSDVTVVDHVKVFRSMFNLRFQGRIHEQILPAIRAAGGEVAWTDLYVAHSGSDRSREGQDRKRQRDLRLLHLELKDQPDHPFTLFNLGMTHVDGEQFNEAEGYLRRSIERSGPGDSQLRKAFSLLVYSQMRLGRSEDALATCKRARESFPGDPELRFREGVLLHELKRLEEAVLAYQDVLTNQDERHFSSVVKGLKGFKARQNLAIVLADMGDLVEAERQWRLVITEMPSYRAGWRGLGDALLVQGRLEEASKLADELANKPLLRLESCLLKGRISLAIGDVTEARRELEYGLALAPNDLVLVRQYCHALFEHGSSEDSERALRRLVALVPDDASVHHNLGTLLLRNRRYKEAAAAYREALIHRPKYVATHLQLGYALKGNGRIAEAASVFENALKLAPGDPVLNNELTLIGRRPSSSGKPAAPLVVG